MVLKKLNYCNTDSDRYRFLNEQIFLLILEFPSGVLFQCQQETVFSSVSLKMKSFAWISGAQQYCILHRIIEQFVIFPLIFYVINALTGGRQIFDLRFFIWCHLNYMALFDVGIELVQYQPYFTHPGILSELLGCTTFVLIFGCFSFASSMLINYWKYDQFVLSYCISSMTMVCLNY